MNDKISLNEFFSIQVDIDWTSILITVNKEYQFRQYITMDIARNITQVETFPDSVIFKPCDYDGKQQLMLDVWNYFRLEIQKDKNNS